MFLQFKQLLANIFPILLPFYCLLFASVTFDDLRRVCNSSYRSLFTPTIHLAEHFVLLSIFQMEFVCLPFMIYRSVPYFSVVHTVKVSISMFTKAQKSEKFSLNDMKSHDFLFGLFVIEATTFAYFEKLEKRPVNTKCTHPSKF